jgi:Flp pilus assembly protein TadG
MLFGLALIPLVIGVGAAVDYGRALIVRERMADAADAAGLAIGSWPGLSQNELKARAQQFFDANYTPTSLGTVGKLKVNFIGDEEITIDVSGVVPTTFMKLANINTLGVSATTTIRKKERNIELVLVLDTTGSMGSGGKLTALKSAAKKMVETLFEGKATSTTLKVGVVPYAATVNIGNDKLNSGWLDKNTYTAANATADPIAFEDLDKTAGMSSLVLWGKLGQTWSGCVRERSSNNTYELTDAPPNSGTPASLWVPYFAPDESDNVTSPLNNYLCDDPSKKNCKGTNYTSTTCVTSSSSADSDNNKRQCYTGKYQNFSGAGPDLSCPPAAITAMTSTKSTVTAAIDALVAKGNTVIPAGLLWGWRTISPTAPFTEGASYTDEKWVKAVVLLTDGENDVSAGSNGFNKSAYGAFGYAKNGHLGSTSGSNADATLDADTLKVCDAIKAAGPADNQVRLYTIGFQVSSASQTLLKNCAGADDKGQKLFYNSPTTDQLAAIFQDIAQGLSELRLAQ